MFSIGVKRDKILWSGGFDSTYLVISKLLSGKSVEAIYLTQTLTWQKQRREANAIDRIRFTLPSSLKSRLFIPKFDELDDDVWNHYYKIKEDVEERYNNGLYSPQIPLLAAMSRCRNGVTAGMVWEDQSSQDRTSKEILQDYRVDLPLINTSKRVMYREAWKKGFNSLLDLTWSCEGNNNEALYGPCGKCCPCKQRINPVNGLPHGLVQC